MKTKTITMTDDRLAHAWYVLYPLDAYALGPYRFDEPVSAATAVQTALEQFGERPCEVWPTGPVQEEDEYEYQVDEPQ